MDLQELISQAAVAQRVQELAADVARDAYDDTPVVLGVLNGAAPFMMDLLRHLPSDLHRLLVYDFVDATSYKGTSSSGDVQLSHPPTVDVTGRRVLVVDGIVDTGRTLQTVLAALADAGASELRTCVLLDKPARREVDVPVDYRGFEIDDQFVVGYGMDLDGQFRCLRHIAVVSSSDGVVT